MKVFKYIVLFLVGFCSYITIEVLFRGYSYPLMGIVGGICLIINDAFNNKVSWDIDILLQGICGSFIVTSIELVIGEIAKLGIIEVMWDYSNMAFNFDGVICIEFSTMWVVLSIVGIFISDFINYYLFEEKPCPYYRLFGHTIFKFKEKECMKE